MNIGKYTDQQFQKLKQGFQTGAKTLGVMGEQAFQGLRKTVSQMPISHLARGDLQGYKQSLGTAFKENFGNPMNAAMNFGVPGGMVGSITKKVGQEALKDSVYQGLKKLEFPATMKNPIENFETQMNIMGKIEKGTHTADDLRSGSELIKLMESKPSSPLAQGKTYYHGSSAENISKIKSGGFELKSPSMLEKGRLLEGISLAKDKLEAGNYGEVVETTIPKDLKLYKKPLLGVTQDIYEKTGNRELARSSKGMTEYLKKQGYDGWENADEITIFDPKKIKVSPTLAQEVGKKKSSVDEIYERLDKYIVKSKDYGRGDLKKLTLADYTFTKEARKLIEENADVKNKSAKYEGKKPPYEAGNEQGKGKDGKDEIEILKPDSNSVVHEFFHTFAQHSPSFKGFKEDFQKAYDKLKPNFEPAQIIDTVLAKDKKNYPDKFRKYDTEERWAYLGEVYSGGGLGAFPESLRPFYKQVIT